MSKFRPCRLTFNGVRYLIDSNKSVFIFNASGSVPVTDEALAKDVIADAKRQRRNLRARQRHQAYTDLGMVRNRDGSYE